MKVRNRATGTIHDATVLHSSNTVEPGLLVDGALVEARLYEVVQCSPLRVTVERPSTPKQTESEEERLSWPYRWYIDHTNLRDRRRILSAERARRRRGP